MPSTRRGLRFLLQDQPVRTFVLIHVEAFAIVATDALAGNDFGSPNRSPLAFLFADLAGIAFRPTLDPKDSEIGE